MSTLESLWAWIVLHHVAILWVVGLLLPTLITATSHYPVLNGLLRVVAELLDRAGIIQHRNSQPRKILGHFKLPGMRSLPPVGMTQRRSAFMVPVHAAGRALGFKCPVSDPTVPAPGPVPVPAPPTTTPIPPTVLATLPKIALVDFGGTNLNPADLAACAAALSRQVNEQFAMPPPVGWGISVQRVRACKPSEVEPDEWVLGFYATADQPGALGYHDRTPTGMPTAHVFPLLDAQDGQPWQPTASHELLEMLADPELNTGAQDPNGVFHALEVCDAVENDTYQIDGVPVSNWDTPAWFSPPENTTGVRYDHMGNCTAAFQLRPGGYDQTWDPSRGWVQSFAQRARAYRKSERTTSRAARRAAKAAAPDKAAA